MGLKQPFMIKENMAAAAANLDSAAPESYTRKIRIVPNKAAPEQLDILGRLGPRFIARATGARASVNRRGLTPRASAEHEPALLSRLQRYFAAPRRGARGCHRCAVADRQPFLRA